MNKLLKFVLSRIVVAGDLHVVDSTGRTYRFGDGSGKPVAVRFTSRAAEYAVLRNPELRLGEAYMDGTFVVEQGTIYDFLDLVGQREDRYVLPWSMLGLRAARYVTRRLRQLNHSRRARRNVAHHYDLDGRLYKLFLDADEQYSCAYFENEHMGLEEAQLAKKRHLAAKLDLAEGHRVLDIGSGWGGLALYLADTHPVSVTGITLSQEQHATSVRRATQSKLSDRVGFELCDYRRIAGPFDRIVSVGMFEHVGVGHYDTFFRTVRDLLTDDGVMVLHSIGRFGRPGSTNPWMAKYIFPGGYIPALSEVLPAIERSGLLVTDVEILRLHYAETLREWRHRFVANWARAAALYDERFCRMWEFYLAGSEISFRRQGMMVFQIQLAKHQKARPLTRRYMTDNEDSLRTRDAGPIRRSSEAAE
jgi:cyclopropane-fatty-acyl-phospholipid synthase